MDPWTEWQHTYKLPPMSMEPWAATKKALHQCGGDTSSCPGPYPTVTCPEFHVCCRLNQNFSTCIHIKAINHPYIKSNFAHHILNTGHKYTNIQTSLQILHKIHKGLRLNTLKQFTIYKYHKTLKKQILNDQITYNDHILYNTTIQQNPPPLNSMPHPPLAFQTLNSNFQY